MNHRTIYYSFLSILYICGYVRGIGQLQQSGNTVNTSTGQLEHFTYRYNGSSNDHKNNDNRSRDTLTVSTQSHKYSGKSGYGENNQSINNQLENNHQLNYNTTVKRKFTVLSFKDRQLVEIRNRFSTKDCSIKVANTSIRYFQNWLKTDPHFIQFRITLNGNTTYRSTNSIFKPFRWSWTPNTTAGPYPFLSWNIDYGVLSFGLLETSTVDIPHIYLKVKGDCNLTFGTNDTSYRITEALGDMLRISVHSSYTIPYSYFCFLRVRETILTTLQYYASLYIVYPIVYISYECCTARYNYDTSKMKYDCADKTPGIHKWDQTSLLPFLVGLLILAYCPIYFCELLAWMFKREHLNADYATRNGYMAFENENDWVYENGESPLSFRELLSFSTLRLENTHPLLISRLRRFICHLLMPSVIYFQLMLYRNGIGKSEDDKVTVKDLVDVGTPMGFLSILGSPDNRNKVFVPYLGGPFGVVILYFILGTLFLVFPRSLKQVIEDGLPSDGSTNENSIPTEEPEVLCEVPNMKRKSPLFFGDGDIVKASMVNVRPDQLEPGYKKGATLMRCNIYMLFTKSFWSQVWQIQSSRISIIFIRNSTIYKKAFVFLSLPTYIVFCLLETLCCIIYYGIPFCFYVVVIVKGASTGLVYLKEQIVCLSFIFKYRVFTVLGVTIVFVLSSVYAYIVALIFLKSFGVLSQIFVLCFISIIIYPSVTFGYIFFFTAALYFCFRQIRHFDDVYTNLLSTAVELTDSIEGSSDKVSISDCRLILSNIRYENVKDVRVNGKLLDVTQNILRTVLPRENLKIREKNNILGIPRKLFEHLVKCYRPVHQQVLSLLFKVVGMAALITATLSISSDYVPGPTSEISEVMHVIFIIAVGTLPELIEVTVSHRDDEYVQKEIEKRKIEQSIRDFWMNNCGIQN